MNYSADAGKSEHTLPAPEQAVGNLNVFRTKMFNTFTGRKRALVNIVDALCLFPGPVDCVAHLSLACPDGLNYGTLYAGLTNAKVNQDGLTGLLMETSFAPGMENVYSVDATSYIRPDCNTVDGLSMVYDSSKKGTPADAGWQYQFVVRQSHRGGSWGVPVRVDRIVAGQNKHVLNLEQLTQIAALHEGSHPPLVVFDGGYSASQLTYDIRKANIDLQVLVRVDSSRVWYEKMAEPAGPRLQGRPQTHGRRLECASPHTDYDLGVSFTRAQHGQVTVVAYNNYHQKITSQVSDFGNVDKKQMSGVNGVLLHVTCTDSRKGMRDMWLFYSGSMDTIDLKFLFDSYVHRFDIEHFFRFCKQTLGLASAKLSTAKATDTWVTCIMCAYVHLWLARGAVDVCKHPWEKTMSKARSTPGRARRVINLCWNKLIKLPSVAKTYKGGTGRVKGAKNTPRTQHETYIAPPRKYVKTKKR